VLEEALELLLPKLEKNKKRKSKRKNNLRKQIQKKNRKRLHNLNQKKKTLTSTCSVDLI
jgi:hypothetical protein